MTYERTNKSLYFQVGVIACAILFGFVCGVFYNKAPGAYQAGALRKQQWCAPPGEYCGNINLGQVTECCAGDPCIDRGDPYNWKCGIWWKDAEKKDGH